VCGLVEELPGRGLERLLLQRDGRVAELRRELQRVDARRVADAVEVDAPDVAFLTEPVFELAERLLRCFCRSR
jgi:hypothetical protein